MTAPPKPDDAESAFPTIERLADLTRTHHAYQGPVLVEEAVRCWHRLTAAIAARDAAELERAAYRARILERDETINLLGEKVAALKVERDDWRNVVKSVCDDMECLPACDSYAHEEFCPVAYPQAAWAQLRAEIAALNREVDRLTAELEVDKRQEIAALKQQLADMTTDYLRRHKDATDRFEEIISLARDIEEYIQRDTERLKEIAELREQIAHDAWAYLGALGHGVPGTHDGKLSDGTTPENVLAASLNRYHAAEIAAAQAENEVLREQNYAMNATIAALRERLRELMHLAWHVCESSEERVEPDEIVVDRADFEALCKVLPEDHPDTALVQPGSAVIAALAAEPPAK